MYQDHNDSKGLSVALWCLCFIHQQSCREAWRNGWTHWQKDDMLQYISSSPHSSLGPRSACTMIWFLSLIDSRIAEHEAQSPEIWDCNRSTMEVLMLLIWILYLQLERPMQCERFRFGLVTLNDTTAPHLQWDLPVRVCHFRLCWFAERPLLTGLFWQKFRDAADCALNLRQFFVVWYRSCKENPFWPNEPGSFRVNVNNETTEEKTSRGSSGHDFTCPPKAGDEAKRTTLGWLLANLLSITPIDLIV